MLFFLKLFGTVVFVKLPLRDGRVKYSHSNLTVPAPCTRDKGTGNYSTLLVTSNSYTGRGRYAALQKSQY